VSGPPGADGSVEPGSLVFITGATGFIGGRLAEALAGRGYKLRCLVRNPARAARLQAQGAEIVVGDVADADAMRRGLDGASLAYHVAAMYDIGRVDVAAMERTNVGGTRAFLDAAREAGLPRSVYVSTIAALGPVSSGDGDEDTRYDGPFPTHYHRTKTEAHRLALAAQSAGMPLIIACPAFVYGPGDEGPAGDFLEDILRHRLPGLPTKPTIFSYVYVDDVVAGLVAAAERGRPGSTYVLSGETASTTEFARRAARVAGTWVSPLRFPGPAVRLTGVLMDAVSSVTGWRMPISREAAASGASGQRWVHSWGKAARELGYQPRSLDEGLPPTVADAQARLS
jgi:nucleoside-diphosphate-sugar epimerase